MQKKYKRINKNIITFQAGDDYIALALAKRGMSNRAIRARTSLSNNQINYRLHRAKTVEDLDWGYRVAFRNGVSPLAQQVIRDTEAVVRADIMRNVVEVIIHPTPEVRGAK